MRLLIEAMQQLVQMFGQLNGGGGATQDAPLQLQHTKTPMMQPVAKPAAPAAAEPPPASDPAPQFSIGPATTIRPVSENLPDVSSESIPLELEEFTAKYQIEYGTNGWQKTDGSALSLKEEALAVRRSELLGGFHQAAVTVAGNNARAAGTTLTTENMTFFLGDANAPVDRMTGLKGMNPQWTPADGPPPQFEPGGRPIPGTVGAVVGGINRSSSSGSIERWPPAPATADQLAEYQRHVSTMRAHGSVISGSGPGLPPAPNAKTIELVAKKQGGPVSIDTLNDLSRRWVLDAIRYESSGGNVQSSNAFSGNPALFAAFKSGDLSAFERALG